MRIAALLAIALALPGCDREPRDTGLNTVLNDDAPVADLPDTTEAGARFRFWAREAYRGILLDSCGTKPLLRHGPALAGETAAIRAFEDANRSSAAGAHLAIARGDIEYQRAANTLGCWEDYGKAEMARSHVDMAREQVARALTELKALAPHVPGLADPAGVDAVRAAKFRAVAHELVDVVTPVCRMIAAADNDQVLAPARAELARLRQRLGSSPYALHFALVEGDIRYERDTVMVECAAEGSGSAAAASASALAAVKAFAARLLALAGL